MDIQDLDDLTRIGKEEINPFRLLGIEPWVLRSMDIQYLKRFLSDFRKVIAKYHHPDKFQDPMASDKHGQYFKIVSSAIDRMLQDEFYFTQSLDDLRSDTIFHRQERALSSKENQLRRAKETIQDLEGKLAEKEDTLRNVNGLFFGLRAAEFALLDSLDVAALVPNLRCDMTYAQFYDYGNIFTYALRNLIEVCNSSLKLETKARDALSNQVHSNHYFSEKEKREAMSASRRVVKAQKENTEAKEEDVEKAGKTYPLFDVGIQRRAFTCVHRHGTKEESKTNYEIIGSLTFTAIMDYYRFHRKRMTEPSDLRYNALGGHSVIVTEFSFDDFGKTKINPFLEKVLPFVSNFVLPYTFLLVNSERTYRLKTYNHYEVVVPIKVSDIIYAEKVK